MRRAVGAQRQRTNARVVSSRSERQSRRIELYSVDCTLMSSFSHSHLCKCVCVCACVLVEIRGGLRRKNKPRGLSRASPPNADLTCVFFLWSDSAKIRLENGPIALV